MAIDNLLMTFDYIQQTTNEFSMDARLNEIIKKKELRDKITEIGS